MQSVPRKRLRFRLLIPLIILLICILTLKPIPLVPVAAAGAFVQGPATGASANSDSITVSMGAAPSSGDTLVAVVGSSGSSAYQNVSSIAQVGVTWNLILDSESSGYGDVEIWSGVVGAGASTSVTVTLTGTPAAAVADICEFSGIASYVDQTATTNGSGVTTDTGTTPPTSQAGELWIGGIMAESGLNQASPTNGFTLLDGVGYDSLLSVGFLYDIVSSTGTADTGTTVTGSTSPYAGAMATFGLAAPGTQVDSIGGTQFYTSKTAIYMRANQITASESGSLESIGVNLQAAAGDIAVAVYTDSSNTPGTLVGQSGFTTPAVLGWTDVPVTGVTITAGTKYWLAWQSNATVSVYYNLAAPGTPNYYIATNPYGSFPTSPSWVTETNDVYNTRMTYSSVTPTTTTTSTAFVTATQDMTSSASTTSSTSTVVGSTTSTVTEPPVATTTVSATITVTGPTAGTATTIFTSVLSTSYSTVSTVTVSSAESDTQTGTVTTGTVQSETTTSTATQVSTTTSSGTVKVSETDTFYVLLTQIYQELEQFEGFILQNLGFQETATPVGQQVNSVIVTVTTPTTSTTSLVSVTTSTTTTSFTSTTSRFPTVISTSATTVSQPPTNTNTLTTTTTTTGLTAGTSTTTFTSPLVTSFSTSSTTSSFGETTVLTGTSTIGTVSSETTVSTSTKLVSTTSEGTVTVTETDTFQALWTNIVQELHLWADEILQVLGIRTTSTPVGQQVNRVVVTVPKQVTLTVSFSVAGSGSPTAPVFHYVVNGKSKSVTLTTTATKVKVDGGSSWSVTPNPLIGSTSSERWDSNQTLSGEADSSATIVFIFYHQTLQTLSYTLKGGGTANPPKFQSKQFGSSASVTLTTTPTGTWFDYGAGWTVTNPLGGSTSSERWFTSQTTSGTIGSASSIAFTYQHQYYLTMLTSSSTAGTVSPKSGWYNAGRKVTITATAKTGHTFQSWTGSGAGSYTGTSNPVTITMNSAISETANFT